MTKKIITILTIFIWSSVFSQNKMNYWHFGDSAGLDFSNGNPVPSFSSLYAYEGVASISDGCSALFYTDGDTIFDRTDQPMPNGIGLAGRCSGFGISSNSQSAIIIPQPNSDSLFFIFTVDCIEDTLIDGLQYSVVDMSLNGGFGDVLIKNVPLKATVEEKITATRHSNGCDYWIVVHEYYTNAFYSYLLTSSGLNPIPVISNTGQIHGQTQSLFDCARGYMKFSPDGSKIAVASTDGVFDYCNFLFPEMFNFDNNSGIVSSAYIIDTIVDPFYGSVPPPYGVSFSPDNSKLYMSSGFYGWMLYQYNLLAGTPDEIMNSRVLLSPQSSGRTISALQNGPDGKIYIATDSTFLSVIENPNAAGIASNYIHNFITLQPETWSTSGLPNFPDNFLSILLNAEFNYTLANVGATCLFSDLSNAGNKWKWDFGDGSISSLQNPSHIYTESGIYTVTLSVFDGCDYDKHCETFEIGNVGVIESSNKVNFKIFPNPTSSSLTIDFNNSNQCYTFSLFDTHGKLIKQIGELDNKKTIDLQNIAKGLYYVNLSNEGGRLFVEKLVIE